MGELDRYITTLREDMSPEQRKLEYRSMPNKRKIQIKNHMDSGLYKRETNYIKTSSGGGNFFTNLGSGVMSTLEFMDEANRQYIAPIINNLFTQKINPIKGFKEMQGGLDGMREGLATTSKVQRFAAENAPFVLPGSTGLKVAQLGLKGGKVAGILGKTARVIDAAEALPITASKYGIKGGAKAFKKVSKMVKPTELTPSGLVEDLQPFTELVAVNFKRDFSRRLADNPVLRQVFRWIGPANIANDSRLQYATGLQMSYAEGVQKAGTSISEITRHGDFNKIIGSIDKDGFLSGEQFIGKKIAPTDLVQKRGILDKHKNLLTQKQLDYIKSMNHVEEAKKNFLIRNNIDINLIEYHEGGTLEVHAGRRIMGKIDKETGELIEARSFDFGAGPTGAKSKLGALKPRTFATEEEAIVAGWRYLAPDRALELNVNAAYRHVAEKNASEWMLDQLSRGFIKGVGVRSTTTPNSDVAKIGIQAIRSLARYDTNLLKQSELKLVKSTKIGIEAEKEIFAINTKYKRLNDMIATINQTKLAKQNSQYLRGILKEIKKVSDDVASNAQALQDAHAIISPLGDEKIFKDIARVQARYTDRLNRVKEWEPIWEQMKKNGKTSGPVLDNERSLSNVRIWAGKVLIGENAAETEKIIRASFTPSFSNALGEINKVNAIARAMVLAGDASVFSIQLAFLASRHPKIFGRAVKGYVLAFFDPEYHAKLITKHRELINESHSLILSSRNRSSSHEVLEAFSNLQSGESGLFKQGESRLKSSALFIPRVAGKGLAPFARAYESAIDTAGIELKKAFKHMATTAEDNLEIDAFINEFRGLASSQRIGVSGKWRQVESATVLAPRYNRAIAALLYDVVRGLSSTFRQGSIRGKLARDSMKHGVAGIMAMSVAITILQEVDSGWQEERSLQKIVDHINPANDDFLTWTIAGQRIGLGTKVRSIMKLWANSARDPENLIKILHENWTENPVLKGIRANFSPTMKTGVDLLTGKHYMGEPSRDNMLQLTDTVIGENGMPLWVHSILMEGGTIGERFTRGLSEFVGFRGYPQPASGIRADLRQDLIDNSKYRIDYSQELFPSIYNAAEIPNWEKLRTEEQRLLTESSSELKEVNEQVQKDWLMRKGNPYEKAHALVNEEHEMRFNSEIELLAIGLMHGDITWQDYNSHRAKLLEAKSAVKEYAYDMKEYLDKESIAEIDKWLANRHPDDIIVDKYMAIAYEGIDGKGLPIDKNTNLIDWGAIYKAQAEFKNKQSLEDREYIEREENAWIHKLPETAYKMEIEREKLINTLIPYWNLEDEVYDEVAELPGSQNIRESMEAYKHALRNLDKELVEAKIDPSMWGEYRRMFSQAYSPEIMFRGQWIKMTTIISSIKDMWKIQNPQGAIAADTWNRKI